MTNAAIPIPFFLHYIFRGFSLPKSLDSPPPQKKENLNVFSSESLQKNVKKSSKNWVKGEKCRLKEINKKSNLF